MSTTMNRTYFDALRAMKKLNERFPHILKAEEKIPKFLICGLQSVGKTSLLEAIANMPLGFTAEGTATRCPVEYELEQSFGSESYAIVNGKKINVQDLRAQVRVHMEVVKETGDIVASGKKGESNNFSHQILNVKIVTPDARNMILLDTPGLKSNAASGKERKEIENILTKLVSSKEYNLIVVYFYQRGNEVNSDYPYMENILNSARPNWKNELSTVEVCNGINMGTFIDSNFFVEELRDLGTREGNNFFVVLKYGEFLDAEKRSKRSTNAVPIPFDAEVEHILNIGAKSYLIHPSCQRQRYHQLP